MQKYYAYAGFALLGLGLFLGGIVTNIIFFGILTAGSLVFLVESNHQFKMFVGRFGFLFDLILFVLSAIAVATLGVTVAGGLAVASLLFTVYRVSYLSPWYKAMKDGIEDVTHALAKTFNQVYDYFAAGWATIKSLFTSKTAVVAVEA